MTFYGDLKFSITRTPVLNMKLKVSFLLAPVAVATHLIIPLYQYPAGNGAAWNPILEAVQNKTNLNATIIINPGNGPGNGVVDPQYLVVSLLPYMEQSAGEMLS
ncbi:hypothetical protein B0T14DRAFT_561422 [Immersiella caudata]|uniref:Uncharacterized protein n=1 Tax=Immersiella caudata TaxID=314043 RepID=A0AA39XH34_9PEZI|nr:hypothetical protein B0T14DRAFT_561422 [Immersiella caudata]